MFLHDVHLLLDAKRADDLGREGRSNGEAPQKRTLPCHPLFGGPSWAPMAERCFGWGEGLRAQPAMSPAPMGAGSWGWSFTEFDSAWAANPRSRPGDCRPARGAVMNRTRSCYPRALRKSKPGLTAFITGSRAVIELHSSGQTRNALSAGNARATRIDQELDEVTGAEGPGEILLTYLSSYEG